MDPSNADHRERLSKALAHSYEALSPFRRSRRDLIEDYAGSRYPGVNQPETYVNLIQSAAEAYQIALSYNEPRFLITAARSEQRSFGERFQVALNTYAKKIHLGDTLRAIIQDAIFLVGIAKIHLADSPEITHEVDLWSDPGMPYVSRVSFDNWVHDVSKSDFRFAQFYGDRFSMDFETAKDCPYFDKKVRAQLQPTTANDRNDRWDLTSGITQDENGNWDDGEIEDVIDLVNIYLPKEKIVCTWPVYNKFELAGTNPLCTLPWSGPETGPYRFLSFIDVPDNIMPTSPAQSLCALFYLYNYLMRKIARRAKQQKDVLPYEAGSQDDMSRAMMAEDMQSVKVNRLAGINVMKFPGPDQNLIAFTYGLSEIFNQAAGNPKTALGIAPSSSTVGQEQLLNQNAGTRIAEGRRRVNRFVSEVGTDVGWLLFDDPQQVIPGERQVPGTDFSIDASWHPPDQMQRQGGFGDYDIAVEPYSMEYKSPEQRLGSITQALTILGPFIPLAQQQGMEFRFDEVLKDFADLSNEPRLANYFRLAPPPPTAEGGAQGPSMRPPGTGQYTRTNVSEKTGDGQLEALMTQQPPQEAGMAG